MAKTINNAKAAAAQARDARKKAAMKHAAEQFEMEGPLEKLSGGASGADIAMVGIRRWKKHIFKLKNNSFWYHRENGAYSDWVLSVADCSVVIAWGGNRRCFEVRHPGRNVILKAQSEAEAEQWVDCFLGELNPNHPHPHPNFNPIHNWINWFLGAREGLTFVALRSLSLS